MIFHKSIGSIFRTMLMSRGVRGFLIGVLALTMTIQMWKVSPKAFDEAASLLCANREHIASPSLLSNHLLPSRADWKRADLPEFCKRMISEPVGRILCKKDLHTQMCGDKANMWAQNQQDFYLFKYHFSKLNRSGVYLDVAAHEPIGISNTFFFDRCLGWHGICVEGNPKYAPKLHRERSCLLVPTCASNKEHNAEFALADGAGGVLDTNKNAVSWKKLGREPMMITMKCTRMAQELERVNLQVVDYLSLDVEGHELQVLQGFDWESTRVNVFTIEVAKDSQADIENFLSSKGYVRHIPTLNKDTERSGTLRGDLVYLHSDVVWGSPI